MCHVAHMHEYVTSLSTSHVTHCTRSGEVLRRNASAHCLRRSYRQGRSRRIRTHNGWPYIWADTPPHTVYIHYPHIPLCKGTPYIALGTLPYLGAPPQFFADIFGATGKTCAAASAPRRRAPGTPVFQRRFSS